LAGIYVHIPYCKTICHYCDFYKTANTSTLDKFVECILMEIELKKDFIFENISTIYFGGGTPSVLEIYQLERILNTISKHYQLDKDIEITIEINPDDSDPFFFQELIRIGFNRLSIGIQSFNDSILKYLNRRHNAKAALKSIEDALEFGFQNISIDLIYGIPNQSFDDFNSDLKRISDSQVNHLSAYHLGIEDNTYFGKLKAKNRFIEIDESSSRIFYDLLIDWASNNNFDHYEVSNFARDNKISRHNKSYWFSAPYIGFGPSAHSFFYNKRSFNIANVKYYIDALESKNSFSEEESLSFTNKYNEYIMLRLRTKWGIDLLELSKIIDSNNYLKIIKRINQFKESGYLSISNNKVILNENGSFISDYIIRELIISE